MKKRNVLIGEREQLPNARGTFFSNNYQIQSTAGVFSSDSGGSNWGQGSGNSGPWNTKRFSLSKGQIITTNPNTYKTEAQSVFKDNGYVRPSNTTVRIWKRIN